MSAVFPCNYIALRRMSPLRIFIIPFLAAFLGTFCYNRGFSPTFPVFQPLTSYNQHSISLYDASWDIWFHPSRVHLAGSRAARRKDGTFITLFDSLNITRSYSSCTVDSCRCHEAPVTLRSSWHKNVNQTSDDIVMILVVIDTYRSLSACNWTFVSDPTTEYKHRSSPTEKQLEA